MLGSVLLVGASGCAHLNWETPAAGGPVTAAAVEPGAALAWWSRAVEASPAQREAMLRNAQQDRSQWRVAMLRSLPGSGHEDTPAASQEALRALLKRGLRDEEEALTRIRVAELGQAQACRAEASELRMRLGRIIEIERDMGHGR
jgi:hypothetical protein